MRPTLRPSLVIGVTVVIALTIALITSAVANTASSSERKFCGTYRSDSIYKRAKVIALRGVGCRKARRVAKKFDHTGDRAIGRFRCAYAHQDVPNLFSCGWPAHGNLRHAKHALLARGIN